MITRDYSPNAYDYTPNAYDYSRLLAQCLRYTPNAYDYTPNAYDYTPNAYIFQCLYFSLKTPTPHNGLTREIGANAYDYTRSFRAPITVCRNGKVRTFGSRHNGRDRFITRNYTREWFS